MLLAVVDSVGSLGQFLVVLFLFICVLLLTYFTTRYIAELQKGRIRSGNMELVETLRISNSKYLQIVRAGKTYLVMAVCKDTVTLLAKLNEDDLILEESNKEAVPDFRKILNSAKGLLPNKHNENSDEG